MCVGRGHLYSFTAPYMDRIRSNNVIRRCFYKDKQKEVTIYTFEASPLDDVNFTKHNYQKCASHPYIGSSGYGILPWCNCKLNKEVTHYNVYLWSWLNVCIIPALRGVITKIQGWSELSL